MACSGKRCQPSLRKCLRTLTSRSQFTRCEQKSQKAPFPPNFGSRTCELTRGGTCVGSAFCIRVSLTRVTLTGASSSNKLQRSSFGLLISRRWRRCGNPRGAPSVSLQPPGVTGAPRRETEPLPLGHSGFLFGLVLMSCSGQPSHLCFVLFAMSCLALGSLACSHRCNTLISPFWP